VTTDSLGSPRVVMTDMRRAAEKAVMMVAWRAERRAMKDNVLIDPWVAC